MCALITPALNTLQTFKKARSLGLGDHDFSAVFEAVKDLKSAP